MKELERLNKKVIANVLYFKPELEGHNLTYSNPVEVRLNDQSKDKKKSEGIDR